ncbi:MAG: plasmid pRiA4b ORF-3 family protein [Cellulosimicrobium cellulans]
MNKPEAHNLVRRESILEVRVELVHSEPSIWRRLEMRGSLDLGQVHRVLQAAFDWEDAHLHRFTPDGPFAPLWPVDGEIPEVLQWLPGRECDEPGDRPEEEFTLEQLLALRSGAAFYEYDFGDSWLHRLELVSRRPADENSPLARLIDGARRGPLEDSGGLPGYEEIMDALADPSHPDHAEHSAWVVDITGSDEPFDPAFLDIAAVNQRWLSSSDPGVRGEIRQRMMAGNRPFWRHSPACFKRPITDVM